MEVATSPVTADKTSWSYLPAEIRILILECVLQDGCSLAGFAIVSLEWQMIIEPHNFARIKLTSSRLADFGPMIHRNRALVHYIWLCLELQKYDCTACATHSYLKLANTPNPDAALVATALQDVLSTLSTWKPNGELLLDISVHSPSDSEHWFKYLTFEPDLPSDECSLSLCTEQSTLANFDDHQHGWISGSQNSPPPERAFYKLFDTIIDIRDKIRWSCPLEEVDRLPLVPAVTGLLLRQQTRRRWRPNELQLILECFPRLQDLYYEPWRQWEDFSQKLIDRYIQSLLKYLGNCKLRRLTIFENFAERYPASFKNPFLPCSPTRIPEDSISRAVADKSRKFEYLSASFIVDASYFFNACKPHWKWPSMTSLTLTSRLLTPDENPVAIDDMLQQAAAVAMKMPNLKSMEIWNGRKGLAMLFRYHLTSEGVVLALRGTWPFALRPPIVQAWENVAPKHCSHNPIVVEEMLDADVIKSHGDAIHHLKFLDPVIRPISLRQIRMEHRVREGLHG
ncbi:hypothetical protein N7520_001927 [Penicillium odoratum]|uniref:uncharacterized protein n=1 Tax=Penicillium odoratum TaxID=1167516 RepID=UPI00254929A1|nr:uncharacterized protein N7520_001927 [Penicillium odoratum]KAJ5778681.1 hypothetical protein N7520_001927 [Penicillium odoratum]